MVIEVSGAEAASLVGAPASARADLTDLLGKGVGPARLRLTESDAAGQPVAEPIPVQFEAADAGGLTGTLWWLMPPGDKDLRRFKVIVADSEAAPALKITTAGSKQYFDVAEGDVPVLRYNQGTVPVPAGIAPKYARGDYIQPLIGLNGEVLTDDYPKDHPHHRGVGWSWPATRWKDEVRDIWAVVGVWARPVAVRRVAGGPVMAVLEAENVWKWGDKEAIVREDVALRVFRHGALGRFVDVEVRLTALADGVAIGGRPHGGYGGFGMRAAPVENQVITSHTDDEAVNPRRSWLDYSGVFAGGKGTAGVAIFEHPTNPGYPNTLLQYPSLNYVMPAFPGEREVPLSKDTPLVLRHRLWIHAGNADETTLANVWAAYGQPPTVVFVP